MNPSRGVMRFVGTWGNAFVPEMTMLPNLREDRPGRGGDHEPFIARGYSGVRLIETREALTHQHSSGDLVAFVTPSYTARIARVVVAAAGSLARAPAAPTGITATGNASALELRWTRPALGAIDHYVVGVRPVADTFYAQRVRVDSSLTSATPRAADLGIENGRPFYVSVAPVDAAGHESLFAYPEYRCDGTACVVPPGSLNVTAQN